MVDHRWQGARPVSKGTGQRLRIISVLANAKRPLTVKEIQSELPDQKPVNVRNLLPHMLKDGEISSPARGVYAPARQPELDLDGVNNVRP